MIKILIRNGFRSLVKQMPYSFINILGLTIGVAFMLVIIIWISVETSYDKFHKDKERLYRVSMIFRTPNKDFYDGAIYDPAGQEYKKEFPVIEDMARIVPEKESVAYNNKFSLLYTLYTDKNFFDMFSFTLIKGDKASCLESPQSIVLTEKSVKKIFGSEDPIGKGVLISGNPFIVTAVAKHPPVNTNLQFECLLPLSVREKNSYRAWDGGLTCYTYLKLIKGADPSLLEKQIMDYMEGVINKKYREFGYLVIPYLQNIGDIHLDLKTESDMGEVGSRMQVIGFSGIGLLILLIACFNFVNISTALSFRRTKEVSIKKIFGSGRKNIILFFVFESAVAIIVSLLLAFLLAKVLLPSASEFVGKVLTLTDIKPFGWLLIYASLFLFCTIFASFYSSFYLSSISPLALLGSTSTMEEGNKVHEISL